MSRSYNKIILVGNVGRDPEVRTTQGGTQVANFSVATSRVANGNETTDWHRCTAWGKTADIVQQYVKKGERILVEGEMRYGSYQKDGVNVPTAEVNVWNILLLGTGQPKQERTAPTQSDDDVYDDGLPF